MNLKRLNIILGVILILGLITIGLKSYQIFPFDKTTQEDITDIPKDPIKVATKKSYDKYMQKGQDYYDNGYFELALNEFIKANQEESGKAEPLIKLGLTQLALKNNGKARSNFNSALEIDSTNLEGRMGLAKSYIAERDMEEAKKILDPLSIENAELKFYQGIVYAYFQDYEKSKEAFIKGMSFNPDQSTKDKIQKFITAYEEFAKNKGGLKIHLQTLLSKALTEVDQQQIAIPILKDVLKEKANYIDAWTVIGYAYLKEEKYQDAIDALEEAKKLAPEKGEALFFLGIAYSGDKKYDQALENFNLSLQNGYQPQASVKQKMAEIYVLQGDYEKGAQTYEELVTMYDKNIDLYIQPIWLYIDKLNQPQKALSLANTALKKHPNEAMAENLVGWAQISNNNFSDGKKHLVEAIKLDAELDAAYYNLGLLYEKKKQSDIAIKLYQKAAVIQKDENITKLAQAKYQGLLNQQKNYQANITTDL